MNFSDGIQFLHTSTFYLKFTINGNIVYILLVVEFKFGTSIVCPNQPWSVFLTVGLTSFIVSGLC